MSEKTAHIINAVECVELMVILAQALRNILLKKGIITNDELKKEITELLLLKEEHIETLKNQDSVEQCTGEEWFAKFQSGRLRHDS